MGHFSRSEQPAVGERWAISVGPSSRPWASGGPFQSVRAAGSGRTVGHFSRSEQPAVDERWAAVRSLPVLPTAAKGHQATSRPYGFARATHANVTVERGSVITAVIRCRPLLVLDDVCRQIRSAVGSTPSVRPPPPPTTVSIPEQRTW